MLLPHYITSGLFRYEGFSMFWQRSSVIDLDKPGKNCFIPFDATFLATTLFGVLAYVLPGEREYR